MEVRILDTLLNGVIIIENEVFEDERGFFKETFRKDKFEMLGLPTDFVQDNHSGSVKGVLRGLHFQWEPPMGKLIWVTRGIAFLTGVDIRHDSPTLGKWFGIEVSKENKKMVWAPAGFARGFLALSDYVELQYKCTGIYNKNAEGNIMWNDPEIGIEWPIKEPILSERDKIAPTLREWLESKESKNFKL